MFSLLFQANSLLNEIGVIMSNMKRYISQNLIRKVQSHFMNSVFVQSGIYSCTVDCFLEVSRYLFFTELFKLTKRTEFLDLLFTVASNYRNQGGNSSCLPAI